ncbi:MAG: pectate lyase [Lysobacteraceae bacterium]
MKYRLLPAVLLVALCAMRTATAVEAPPDCRRDCEDLLRANHAALPLSQARIDASAGALRDVFTRYLEASDSGRAHDRAALREERQGLMLIPAPRVSVAGGDSMPLNSAEAYYTSDTALDIAREIVSFQVPSGGWGKNMRRDGSVRLRGQSYIDEEIDPDNDDDWGYVGTFDNGATTTEIRYLAKVQAVQTTDRAAVRDSIVRGLDLLFAAQYPNGGWPQNYPLSGGYHDAITLNDDSMLQVVRLLYDVGHRRDSDFAFIDDAMRARAAAAADVGIGWFVAQQVRIGGRRTLWGQQHDALTQLPTAARAFEMPALASSESVRIVAFLMTLPEPDADVRATVYGAVDFLRAGRIDGKRWRDGELLDDPEGSVWARFYALDVYEPEASSVGARVRPLFGDRPQPHESRAYGLVFGTLRAVSAERRRGYAQYNRAAETLLRDFDAWCERYPR